MNGALFNEKKGARDEMAHKFEKRHIKSKNGTYPSQNGT
jgi:hypothetical protein